MLERKLKTRESWYSALKEPHVCSSVVLCCYTFRCTHFLD